jgi:hypothetical protein
MVSKTIAWIKEAMHLRHAGMPPSAYRLHLEGPTKTVEGIWGTIKSCAALCHLTSHTRYHEMPWPIHYDDVLMSCVKLILSGDPTVHLPCPVGTLEEFEEEICCMSEELKSLPRDRWDDYGRNLFARNLSLRETSL